MFSVSGLAQWLELADITTYKSARASARSQRRRRNFAATPTAERARARARARACAIPPAGGSLAACSGVAAAARVASYQCDRARALDGRRSTAASSRFLVIVQTRPGGGDPLYSRRRVQSVRPPCGGGDVSSARARRFRAVARVARVARCSRSRRCGSLLSGGAADAMTLNTRRALLVLALLLLFARTQSTHRAHAAHVRRRQADAPARSQNDVGGRHDARARAACVHAARARETRSLSAAAAHARAHALADPSLPAARAARPQTTHVLVAAQAVTTTRHRARAHTRARAPIASCTYRKRIRIVSCRHLPSSFFYQLDKRSSNVAPPRASVLVAVRPRSVS